MVKSSRTAKGSMVSDVLIGLRQAQGEEVGLYVSQK